MTEDNLFCYAENYGDEDSFQQRRYRVWNKEVEHARYLEIRNVVMDIFEDINLDLSENSWTEAWEEVNKEVFKELSQIPEFDREITEKITGLDLSQLEIDIDIIEVNGIKYRKI